tara:strand:+ start:65 stop:661 length:597 start_codon:yes stop_codon:yes gene_type:complete
MALQTSGTISLANVQSEFGGSNPISINEYYRNGSNVPNSSANSSIPTSGTISLSNFYGGTAVTADNTFNLVVSTYNLSTKIASEDLYGADNADSNLNNIQNGAVLTNNFAVSEVVDMFKLSVNSIANSMRVGISGTGGASRLWHQGNVRGFSMLGTTYSFATASASGDDNFSVPLSGTGFESALVNQVGNNITITLTY